MTVVAVQPSSAALAALEQLGIQPSGVSGPPPRSIPQGLLDPGGASDPSAGADSFSVSGGAAGATLNGLTGGLADAASAADAAVSAGAAIINLLSQMQSAAQSAANPALDPTERQALDVNFHADLTQIGQWIASAQVSGLNLLDGSAVGTSNGTATLAGTDLSIGGPIIGLSSDASLSDAANATAIEGQLGQAIDAANQAVGQIASQSQALQTHLSLVAQAAAGLSPGLAAAINPELDGDGARLQALMVQQQLTTAGSAVANQAPQAILALFQ